MNRVYKDLLKYEISVKKIYYDDDYFEYVASFLQFPDVIGAGCSVDEAIKDASIHLNLYFDYCKDNKIVIPEPVNKFELEKYSGKLTLRIPKMLHKDLTEYAENDGMSINTIVIDSIRSYLNQISLMKFEKAAESILDNHCDELFTDNFYEQHQLWDQTNPKLWNSFKLN